MRCNKCGQELPDNTLFCMYCGEPVNSFYSNNVNNAPSVKSQSSRKPIILISSIAAVLIIITVVIILVLNNNSGKNNVSKVTTEEITSEAITEATTQATTKATTEMTTEITTEEVTTEAEPVETIKETYRFANPLNTSYYSEISIEYGFSEDRAWDVLYDEDETRPMALFDPDGRIYFMMTPFEFRSQVVDVEVRDDFDAISTTRVKNGYAVMYSQYNDGFIIIDKEGNITFNSKDNDENTTYLFLGQVDDKFLIYKESASFSEYAKKYELIDAEGNVIADIDTGEKEVNANQFYDIGGGLIYCTSLNYLINSNNNVFLEIYADVNGPWVRGDYLVSSGGYIRLDQLTSQDNYEENIVRGTDFDYYTFNGETYYYDGAYYDLDGNQVVSVNLPDQVEIRNITCFSGGYAFVYMDGADDERYIGCIDESGELLFDPIQQVADIDIFDYYGGEGYIVVRDGEYGSDTFNSIIYVLKYDGTMFRPGENNSEIKDMTFKHYDFNNSFTRFGSGYFTGNVIYNSYGIEYANYYVSYDGNTILTEANEYE